MALERIDPDVATPAELDQHLERYRFAAWHTLPGESVLDAACGTGYGRELFEPWARWMGVDSIGGTDVIAADLCTFDGWRSLDYDVFVGLETIEHLREPFNYVAMAKAARRTIVLSTPIIPTVETNQYHLVDYSLTLIVAMFSDEQWRLQEYREQVGIYGLFAFKRVA